jgi:tetratricopeptide (TPR) repeat protein
MCSLRKPLSGIRWLLTLVCRKCTTRIDPKPGDANMTDDPDPLAHDLLRAELTRLRIELSDSEKRLENRLTERLSDSAKTLDSYKWTFERFFNILTAVGILITIGGAVGLWQTIVSMGNVSEMTKNVIAQQQQTQQVEQQVANAEKKVASKITVQKTFLSHMAPMLRQAREVSIASIMERMQSRLDSDDVAFMRETAELAKDAAMRESQALATATSTEGSEDDERKAIESEHRVVELELAFYDDLETSLNEVLYLDLSQENEDILNRALTQWNDFQTKTQGMLTTPSQGPIFVRDLDAYAHDILGNLYWRKSILKPGMDVSRSAMIEFDRARGLFQLYAPAWTGSAAALLAIAEREFKSSYEASPKALDHYKALLGEFDSSISLAQRALSLTRDERVILRNGNNIAVALYNKALVYHGLGDNVNAEQALDDATRWIESVKAGSSRIPNIISTEAELRIASAVVDEEKWTKKTQKERDDELEAILDIFRQAKRFKLVYNRKSDMFIDSLWMVRHLEILSPQWDERLKEALELN